MDQSVHEFFTTIDWVVVFLYLAFTTWVGHALRGKQGTIRDFFLGGRSLPWQAVTGSIIATEISALTFIGVPGTVFAVNGDFTYLQWAIGSVIARFAVGYWLVPLYYEREIYSPYDFMGNRLGESIKKLVTMLFSVGAILGQSVRVLVTAIILKVVTGMPIEICIVIIGLFAIGWTLMGGMRTVIWTDVVQFFLFLGGGILALIWLISGIGGGWGSIADTNREADVIEFVWKDKTLKETVYQVKNETGEASTLVAVERTKEGMPTLTGVVTLGDSPNIAIGDETVPATVTTRNKMKLWDFRAIDPETKGFLIFTFWIALFAMPFQNFAAFGTDQLMAQRMFCCENASAARKSILWSSVSQLITVLMLLVSAGLYAWYQARPLSEAEFGLFVQDKNNVFPVWITTVLPVGLSGLLIAGAFAAAISSLDSILAALSQTTLSMIYGREKFEHDQGSKEMVWKSRAMVISWGIGLSLFAILLNVLYQMGEKNLIGFAFRMVSYTYGPMLGILLCAILPVRASTIGIMIGTAISILLASLMLPDLYNVLKIMGIEGKPITSVPFPWFFPVNAAITFGCAYLFGKLNVK
ncbi:MAG: hypothetical protein AAGH89_07760 [Verrucomicrobiota bacterium]